MFRGFSEEARVQIYRRSSKAALPFGKGSAPSGLPGGVLPSLPNLGLQAVKLVLTALAEPKHLRELTRSTVLQRFRSAGWTAEYLLQDGREVGLLLVADARDRSSFEEMLANFGFCKSRFKRVTIYETFDERRPC